MDKRLQDHFVDVFFCIELFPLLGADQASGVHANALAEAMMLQYEFILM